eukprot:3256616-Amphidinium_carterae.1
MERVDGDSPFESRWFGPRHRRVLAGGGIMGSCAGGMVSCLQDMAMFVGMLSNRGRSLGGEQFLLPSTLRSLSRDWLAQKAVVGHSFGRSS